MLDATLQVIDVQVSAPDPDAEVGPEGGIMEIAFIVGLALPVGPNQVAHIPAAILRGRFGKEQAEKLGKTISEGAETLKPASKLTVATDVNAAAQAAEAVESFRNGPQRQGS